MSDFKKPDYTKVMQSPQFTFLVGKDRTPIKIHAGVVEGLSDPLYAMINNGQMKESVSQIAELADVEPQVFTGFCEHAYTGSYTTPSRPEPSDANKKRNLERVFGENSAEVVVRDFEAAPKVRKIGYSSSRPMEVGQITSHALQNQLNGLMYLHANTPKAPAVSRPSLLFHAKMNVFATRYLIESLRKQTIASLHRDLQTFELDATSASVILGLLKFTYENTAPNEQATRPALRELVICYVAHKAHILQFEYRFTKLLCDNGEMGRDLMGQFVIGFRKDWLIREG